MQTRRANRRVPVVIVLLPYAVGAEEGRELVAENQYYRVKYTGSSVPYLHFLV